MIGMACQSAYEIPVYLLSVVLRAILLCSCDFHRMGHPAYDTTYLCRDLAASSRQELPLAQLAAKSASTCTSRSLDLFGFMIIPLFAVE